jgi:glycosyltransferase involved in cell wall biosynthesis
VSPRILFVNHTGELGGAELTLLPIAHRYRDRCMVVLLKDGPLRDRLVELGVAVRLLPGGQGMLGVRRQGSGLHALASAPAVLATVWRLGRLARGFEIIYANTQKSAIVSFLAGKLIGRPVIWYLHDIMSAEHFAGIQRKTVIGLANWAAHSVICNSTASQDAFIACGGDPKRIVVAPAGVDPHLFDEVHGSDLAAIRSEIHVGDAPLIGMFGRLASWKGQRVLIDALPQMEGVHAVFVGDALFGEERYRDEIQDRVRALGVGRRVHWLGFRDDIPQLMRACDLVIHASVSPEPYGRVIVEAMMARRPVIASAHGASAELLGADYPFLVTPGDPAALAEAVNRALTTPPLEMGWWIAHNHEQACKRFSTETMFAEIDRALAA